MLNSKMNSIIGLKSNVFLAPMAGITDYPLRKLVAEKGTANLYSEMVAINAISRRNPKTYRIADVRNEPYPVIVQLVGNDPYLFSEAAKLAADFGAYSLDINMGCPVKKVVGNGSGSALMKNLPLASKIIESTVKATPLKVSVKFRKGWDNNTVNAPEFAKMCEDTKHSLTFEYISTAEPAMLQFTAERGHKDIRGQPTGILSDKSKKPSTFRLSETGT